MVKMDTYAVQQSFHEYLISHPEMANVEMTEIYADWRKESQVLVDNPELASLLLETADAVKDMNPEVFKTLVELDR